MFSMESRLEYTGGKKESVQDAEKGKMYTNNNGEETNIGKQDGKHSNNPMTQ